MSELRWILIALGVALLIGIYLYSRRTAPKPADVTMRREPSVSTTLERAVPAQPDANQEQAPERIEDPAMPSGRTADVLYSQTDLPLADAGQDKPPSSDGEQREEKIIAIHVAARGGRRLRGPDVVGALQQESLEFGEFNIFHRRTGNRAVFSASSMVEPGQFDLDDIESYTTPGITMFMIMPGPESPVATFTEMLSVARRIATVLDAEVLDESGSTLSRQAASHMREQIIEFAHRLR